ncbi:MAG: single-stranded-DNA-specific exonuclease RecJ [Flavitalea sp.]
MPIEKRWKVLGADETKVAGLQQSLKINEKLCRILVQRNIDDFNLSKSYFRPQMEDLHDPWLLKDMEKAIQRIIRAFDQKEKILVFGDYDVDGTTSVACMVRFLRSVCDPQLVDYYIPHRYREGYGVSKKGIDHAVENGFTLIISLDCGIKSVDLIEYALSLNIDFIVCDHHLPDTILPKAVAILNPKQPDCQYPFKELCGCGVGYKLITALSKVLKLPEDYPYQYLDLLATAIAADIVPMVGENRIMAFYGLKKANENPNHGIRAIKNLSNFDKDLQITNLVFMIAPRVNAAGRMDDAKKAVQMFIAPSYAEALEYAEMLRDDNDDRRIADQSITEEALSIIHNDNSLVERKSTVLYQSHWHKGVVGIVASRLIDHYYRPTIVLTQSGEYAAGSARSVSGFNVYEAIHQCKDLLLGYGGHFYAAGMTIEIEKIPEFQQRFEEVVASSITADLLTPEIVIDSEIDFEDINQGFYNIIHQMEPFGPDNLKPVFVTRNCTNHGCKIVKENHIRFSIKQHDIMLTGIGFQIAHKYPCIDSGEPFDIVYTLDENEWNGRKQLQLKIIDFRPSNEKAPVNPGLSN